MYNNSIAGTIPTVINKMPALQLFDVEQNLLTGPAFVNMGGALSLQAYRISENSLTGTIPDLSLSNPTLQELWAAQNLLQGQIPSNLNQLSNLRT